ncbi:MAG: glycine--tRNA ligase [Halobacteria archaeon]
MTPAPSKPAPAKKPSATPPGEHPVLELMLRRGFLWPSCEPYGGFAGVYDYGPLGAPLKRNLEQLWREFYAREGFHEVETGLLAPEEVFRASGHLSHFSDAMAECPKCRGAFRADHLKDPRKCPDCGGPLQEARPFLLMMETRVGTGRKAYLRPETAQGIYLCFKRLVKHGRDRLPVGAFQVGKSFRNEISPRQGPVRLREFTMGEVELFVHPGGKAKHPKFAEVAGLRARMVPGEGKETVMSFGDAVAKGIILHEFLAYHLARIQEFLISAGLPADRIRLRQHRKDELAHYALDCWDAEVETAAYGWIEVVGLADRSDFDLRQHSVHSGESLAFFVPHPKPVKKRMHVAKPKDPGAMGRQYKERFPLIERALEDLARTRPADLQKDPIRLRIGNDEVALPRASVQVAETEVEETGAEAVPHVIEPSFGFDRLLYALLESAYAEDTVEGEVRKRLRLRPRVAPLLVGVLPLLGNHDGLVAMARDLHARLAAAGLRADYDDSGTVGRRYRRYDEVGTPFCVTVDHRSLEDGTVTVRDRDTTEQLRVAAKDLEAWLRARVG